MLTLPLHLLPQPEIIVQVTVPFSRGDLVSRIHRDGHVIEQRHDESGTHLRARVHPTLAEHLRPYLDSSAP